MMKGLFLTLNLALLILGSACQVQEKTSDGSLISGHTPTTNSFKIQTPTPKTYIDGETLSLVVTFPFSVTVTGTPRLALTIGAATRYANYFSGDDSTTLTFQYAIVAADNDSDGITVDSLDLNGGTLTFDFNGVITNCNVATLVSKTFSSIKVDNTVPAPSAMAQTTLPGFYNKNDTLNFTVTFNEAVVVTGSPRIQMDFGTGPAVYANYTGGSGTTLLGFSLTIDNTIAETDAYDSIAGSIDLNGGTIKDSVGNTATLSIAAYTGAVAAAGATRLFDGRLPYVVGLTVPSNGSYVAAQALEFDVEFDRAVTVTGSPYIAVTIGSNVRQATYLSGSGTNVITFSYTTIPGDVDADGIAVASTITANSGTIVGTAAPAQSYFLVAANNTYSVPPTTGIIINAIQPQPVVATRNVDSTNRIFPTAVADNTWIIGQDLLISVSFNTNMYVDQVSGTPRIPITIGAATQYATYLSGGNGQTSLVFRYVIQEGDLDSDGSIAIGSIDLNGGNITDVSNTNTLLTIPTTSLTSTLIDGVKPTVSNVAAPTNGTYSTLVNMDFTVTWSEAVNYSTVALNLPLTIGASAVNAPYISGNNSTTIIHRPTITAGMTDADGIAMASPMTGTSVIKDQAGNTATVLTYTPPVTTGVLVDTTAPTISSVTPPAADTYTAGENLDFTVTFNEVVNVTTNGGYPRIALVMNTGTVYATYLSGTGTTDLVFRYTVAVGNNDPDGITNPTAVAVNTPAYIRDAGLNSTTSYAFTTNLAGVVVDALAPSISSRTIPANGTYDSGDVLTFTTTYNEIVDVTGTPRIAVTAQTGTLYFDYTGGTGTTTLTYSYTVTANDFDFDGLPTSITTVALNGGTIQDVSANNAGLTFTAANLSQVYIAFPDTVIWSTNSFTNRSAIAGLTVSNGGSASLEACGTSTCQTMNGNGSFNISGAIPVVEEVFVVFKTPGTLANEDMFDTDISLVDDGTAFDLNTANATLDLDGSAFSGVNHDTSMGVGTTHILHTIFSAQQSYIAGALIPSTFGGAIGEVIVVTSPLSAAQRTAILTYLNAKY